MQSTDVLVIGGGATGLGVARDAAMRGLRVTLVERGDLASGTSGRYHGLLHSGGRYATKDQQSARECAAENRILRRIIPQCLEDTGGLFVTTPADDPAYADEFVRGCQATGVAVSEISVAAALRREPRLNPAISRAFEVGDAAADSFLTAQMHAADIRARGGAILSYHRVIQLVLRDGRVVGAVCEDLRDGTTISIESAYTVNAAGAWAGQIAQMAGVPLEVVAGKGTMVALNHRLVNTVLNRCKPPDDGDILVPIRTVCVIGTTDIAVPNPDVFHVTAEEVQFMLDEGDILVPGLSQARALRAWAGVRPLYKHQNVSDNRHISRAITMLDHADLDGVAGFLSITGGKWTTFRLMAEQATDVICQNLGITKPCRTADEPLAAQAHKPLFWHGQPLRTVEDEQSYGELICECELVTRQRVISAIQNGAANLDDLRRAVRLGMGPCQGGFCTYRAAALFAEVRQTDPAATNAVLHDFLQERWRGIAPVLWGDQLRQERLDELIYLNVLGVDRLPAAVAPADRLVLTEADQSEPLEQPLATLQTRDADG